MNEPQGDLNQPHRGQDSIDRRAWSSARQWRVAGIGAAAVVIVALALWLGGKFFGPHEIPPAAAAPPGTFRASPQQLKSFTVESVRTHAFVSEELTEGKIGVNGDRATPVISPYSGRVTRVIAGLGDTVKARAPLATLEASEFVQAQNDLRVAASQVKLARISETRKHALYDAKGGSLQDWQQAQADLAAAETALNAVRNRLQIFGKSDAEIAELETLQTMNPSATIAAPIAGVVVDRQVGPGQYLQAGGPPVFTIADPSSVWLLANVRESDAGLVQLGQPVEVRVLAYPKRVFKARVTYVAAVVDPATHRLPVRAEIDNRDLALKPEMFANFRILTSDATEAPAVPEAAVVYEGATAHVWVVAGDGLLSYRVIRTGRSNDGLVEVLDGLKAGERIVTKGGLFIDQAAVPASS
ncbi:MAG TPA: efflux RND transporter periplasmic adaptor subunit [Steroidobacteraceae bacterium]|nr:efflux RND transporter periplasmic adaptor subunit [Steroidobacteraceae bacterium]